MLNPALAQDDDRELSEKDWVLGSLLVFMLHEMGHGLVALWDLPVLGHEEDAADAFSVTYMLDTIENDSSLKPEQIEQLDDALFVTAGVWLELAQTSETDDQSDYADDHSLGVQRFFSHMCLLVGSDPDVYGSWLEQYEIDEDVLDVERCKVTAALQARDWRYLLEVERDEDWKNQGARGLNIKIEPGENEDHRRYESWLKDWPWLRYFEKRLEQDLKLPEPLDIRFAACGEPDAHFDPEKREIVMCYELMEVLEIIY